MRTAITSNVMGKWTSKGWTFGAHSGNIGMDFSSYVKLKQVEYRITLTKWQSVLWIFI